MCAPHLLYRSTCPIHLHKIYTNHHELDIHTRHTQRSHRGYWAIAYRVLAQARQARIFLLATALPKMLCLVSLALLQTACIHPQLSGNVTRLYRIEAGPGCEISFGYEKGLTAGDRAIITKTITNAYETFVGSYGRIPHCEEFDQIRFEAPGEFWYWARFHKVNDAAYVYKRKIHILSVKPLLDRFDPNSFEISNAVIHELYHLWFPGQPNEAAWDFVGRVPL